MPTMRTPDECVQFAKDLMLDGRDPVTPHDWALILNCVAANMLEGTEESICALFRAIYQIPLKESYCRAIGQYQLELKAKKN